MQKGSFVSTPVSILLGSIIIAFSILLSGGVVTIGKPSGGVAAGSPSVPTQAPTAPQPVATPAPTSSKVSVDDDAMLGDKNAPVTIIEFSDYECPFCKRHFTDTHTLIVKDYIDTGKVKLVFRDFPLSFHDPMATYEAQAAECSREQGGDAVYFKMHDEMFKETTSNGTGLTKDKISQIATNLGLNGANIIACADSDKYKDEVKKDSADGAKAGVTGTPTFFVGKSTGDGVIDGKILVGAQPYASFQAVIDGILK